MLSSIPWTQNSCDGIKSVVKLTVKPKKLLNFLTLNGITNLNGKFIAETFNICFGRNWL